MSCTCTTAGRRQCRHCGKGYNLADIQLPADPSTGRPPIFMPPLGAPPECQPHLEVRPDDTEEVVRHRLQVSGVHWDIRWGTLWGCSYKFRYWFFYKVCYW